MPLNTATPIAWRISDPAPWLVTSGETPAMNAMLVMRIGRRRSLAASTAARAGSNPSSCFALANSTIKIAFLAARPISTISPICVNTLLSPPLIMTPAIAAKSVKGTIRITASGSRKLSYCAASTRNTSRMHSGNTKTAVLPARIFW